METKEIIQALKCCHNLDECEDCEYNESGEFCEELLKRDAAERLEELEKISENWCNLNDENMELLRKYREDITELKQQLSEKPEWISVEDRLPEEKQELFMCLTEREFFLVLRGFYANSEWYVYTGVNLYTQCDDIPSFWVPATIIEPPKPKEPTFKDKFLEAFPKATVNENGIPFVCLQHIFGGLGCNEDNSCCHYCWNQPYFEKEGSK